MKKFTDKITEVKTITFNDGFNFYIKNQKAIGQTIHTWEDGTISNGILFENGYKYITSNDSKNHIIDPNKTIVVSEEIN